jgi:hypothetical protein
VKRAKRAVAIATCWAGIAAVCGIGLFAAGCLVVDRTARRAGIALVALLLCACPRPPITHEHHDAFDAAEHGWYLTGLPDPGDCLEGARVEQATSFFEFNERCGLYGAYRDFKAAACLSSYSRGAFGRRDGWLVLVAPDQPPDAYVVVHEAMHALVRCTSLRQLPDIFDAAHSDTRVWSAAGGLQSAQWLSGVRP